MRSVLATTCRWAVNLVARRHEGGWRPRRSAFTMVGAIEAIMNQFLDMAAATGLFWILTGSTAISLAACGALRMHMPKRG